ncbi:hypothetical protein D9M72_524790 [compost metagenome]
MDQHGLPRLEVQAVQDLICRQAGQRKSCGLVPCQGCGLAGQEPFRQRDVFCETTAVDIVLAAIGNDFIAWPEMRGVNAGRLDHPSHVPSGNGRELQVHGRVQVAGHDLPVDGIHRCRLDLDQDHPRPDLG